MNDLRFRTCRRFLVLFLFFQDRRHGNLDKRRADRRIKDHLLGAVACHELAINK